MAIAPFVDIDLEDKVLRLLIFDDNVNTPVDANEISRNISYCINMGINKDVFYSDYKKWMYDQIVLNYVKHSECISQTVILNETAKKYTDLEKLKKRKIIVERILKQDFKLQIFKSLLEDLRNKFNYRSLFNLNFEVHNTLKTDFEAENNGNSLQLARKINDFTNKILLGSERFRVIEEDIFQNLEPDLKMIDDQRLNPEKYMGIPTGFKNIDTATGGWRPGELVVILGRPGMGKSVLLLNFGHHAWEERYNVIYVTIEMPAEQQKRRFFSRTTKMEYSKIKMPHTMHETEVDMLKRLLRKKQEEHKNNYFYIIDAPQNCDANFIESRVIAFENSLSKKADLIIIDPIYLMKPSMKTDDPVGVVSWDLKLLARKLNVPVLCASQFNRESHKRHEKGKGTDTSDAAFSDKLGNNADIMIGITSQGDQAKLTFPKSRDSLITELFFERKFKYMRFEEVKDEPELEIDEGGTNG